MNKVNSHSRAESILRRDIEMISDLRKWRHKLTRGRSLDPHGTHPLKQMCSGLWNQNRGRSRGSIKGSFLSFWLSFADFFLFTPYATQHTPARQCTHRSCWQQIWHYSRCFSDFFDPQESGYTYFNLFYCIIRERGAGGGAGALGIRPPKIFPRN